MKDLEFITTSIKQTRLNLIEFISEDNIREIESFAFEYASQESKYHGIESHQFDWLVLLRTSIFLSSAYNEIRAEYSKQAADLEEGSYSHYELCDRSKIPEMIERENQDKK